MSRLGFKSVTVYDVDTFLGELIVVPVSKDANSNFIFPNNEIRITHISPPSERSRPLSVLQTISSYSVRCKLESNLPSDQQTKLLSLHASCFYELKTAVVVLGGEEIHLVAMPSKQKNFPCFWCCSVPAGLYNSCLAMLNLRCLSIVFDLDETLIVANTMKSFEDKIDKLKGWIAREPDPDRASGMTAELKRYTDDRELLKQYAEYDSVTDGGMIYKVQLEEVPRSSDNEEKVVRPIIRLPDKNIVLTRINPKNRDTSVLVRLRPAWEELRCYLTAKGRKRFEVFVCTMAVRDYALEMWRLLDPEAHLISLKQQGARVVCVKSGSRKSLLNVFQDGICHPNLAMVIDDRLEVWEDKDQSRVHVVPPYTPYYAPQAETAHPVPLLCVARNVACNVRGGFFKEFDENMYRRICDLFYEDDISSLPPPTDVSTFLMIEDTCFIPNGNTNIPIPEGMRGAEVEQRLCHEDEKAVDSSSNPVANVPQMKPEIADQPAVSAPSVVNPQYSMETTPKPKPSLLGVQARRENFSSESDLEKKRRSLTVQHGINMRTPAFGDPPILKSSAQPSSVPSQSQGGWSEEDVMKGHLNHQTSQVPQPYPIAVGQTGMSASQVLDVSRGRGQEVGIRHEQKKQNTTSKQMPVGRTSEVAVSQNHISSTSEDFQTEDPNANASNANLSISALQEIGRRCNSKVEFKYIGIARRDFQFSVEVLFTGEKIGIGMGKTRKDAEQQAAQNALRGLADQYLACVGHASGADNRNFNKLSERKENGFIWDNVNS